MENKIINIMKKNNGIITAKQIENEGISRTYLSLMVKKGIIDRIERGIYVTKEYKYDEYYIFQLKYPKTIFSNNTALYFYEMTDRTPAKLDVTINRNYNPHRFNDIVNVYKVNKNILSLGAIEKCSPQGMVVKVYDLERTICDIIKNDSLDVETRNKAIRKSIKNKDFNANKMFEYAKKMKIYDKVKNYMEAII